MVYKTFGQVNASRLENIERGIVALKRGWNGVARHYAERAEKDFLSVEDFYWISADKVLSEINAIKGLSFYPVRPESVDKALVFIQAKQRMRKVKKVIGKPLKDGIYEIDSGYKRLYLPIMEKYNKKMKALLSEEYESIISDINEELGKIGVK